MKVMLDEGFERQGCLFSKIRHLVYFVKINAVNDYRRDNFDMAVPLPTKPRCSLRSDMFLCILMVYSFRFDAINLG